MTAADSPPPDPRIPEPLLGYRPDRSPAVDGERPVATVDPLGWCVIATTALLTWLFGPATLVVLAAIGFIKYWRAWRSGRTDSNCILGDVRLVLAYLAVLAVVGLVAVVTGFNTGIG